MKYFFIKKIIEQLDIDFLQQGFNIMYKCYDI